MTGRTVLILTHPEDAHADAVEQHLQDHEVEVYRTDTTGLGGSLPLVAHLGGAAPLTGRLGSCDLAQVRCVWHRRPGEPGAQDEVAAAELRAGIGGVLAGLPYLNHPADMAAAALKPHQLVAAARCGLRVPETLIATRVGAAEVHRQRHHGQVVVKPLSRGAAGRVTPDGREGWSRPIHLTQQRIDKVHDIRMTVVDGRPFTVRIDSPHLDWRADPDECGYQLVQAPPRIAQKVGKLVTALRLRYAAIDFAVDRAGDWWFLEVNPNGQWLWLEQATGAPISRALAAALARTP